MNSMTSVRGEFRINTYTSDAQQSASIDANPVTGGFMIVWQSDGQDGDGWGVYGRNFGAGGVAQGAEFGLADMTVGDQENPDVAFNEDGNGMYVWQTTAIYFSAASNPDEPSVAYEFPAANYRTSSKTFGFEAEPGTTQEYYNYERLRDGAWDDDPIGKDAIEPSVISIGGDMFINGWYRKDEDRGEFRYVVDQVSADFDQVISANGDYSRGFAEAETSGRLYTNFGDVGLWRTVDTRFGDLREMLVVTTLSSDLAAADGVIQFQIFQESPTAGQGFLYGARLQTDYNQRFVLDGSGQTGDASRPRVAILEDGGFAITWQEENQTAKNEGKWNSDVYVQVFNADLSARTPVVAVDTKQNSDQSKAEITALQDGGFVMSWTDGVGKDGDDVMIQRFNALGQKLGDVMRVNGTGAGDQGEASLTTLNNGNIAITWESDAGGNTDVFARIFSMDPYGSKQAQKITGTDAGERISTGEKNDSIFGQGGDDFLFGGTGDDVLGGGAGDDELSGAGGKDLFLYDGGADVILGFVDNSDTVQFDKSLVAGGLTRAFLETIVTEAKGSLVFDFGAGWSLRIEGISTFAALSDDLTIV